MNQTSIEIYPKQKQHLKIGYFISATSFISHRWDNIREKSNNITIQQKTLQS